MDNIENNSTDKKSELKRKLIQLTSALIYNADVKHWFNGTISQTQLKKICVPGLNCYSCPGALSSCPLGALQNTLASGKFPFYITGFFFTDWNFVRSTYMFFFVSLWIISRVTLQNSFTKS